MQSTAHAVFELRYHLVLVTRYRRRALTDEMLAHLHGHFAALLRSWRCTLIEFGGEADHVHLLFEAHPSQELARLVNNLKTARSSAGHSGRSCAGSIGAPACGTALTTSAASATLRWELFDDTSNSKGGSPLNPPPGFA